MELPNFEVIKGNKNILISAPHVFPHKRPKLTGVLKQGEQYLDDIVKEICEKTGCWGIYLSKNSPDYDPNYTKIEGNPYKKEVAEIIKNNNIKYFIDLHGLSDLHNFDLGVSFCMRYQRSHRLALQLLNEFRKTEELNQFNSKVGYMARNDQETLTEYVCLVKKVPAFQLEIARYIRKDPVLRDSLISGLSEFIKNIIV